jgi:hypothetical protein
MDRSAQDPLIYGNGTPSVWRWLDRDRSQSRSVRAVPLGTAPERCGAMTDASGYARRPRHRHRPDCLIVSTVGSERSNGHPTNRAKAQPGEASSTSPVVSAVAAIYPMTAFTAMCNLRQDLSTSRCTGPEPGCGRTMSSFPVLRVRVLWSGTASGVKGCRVRSPMSLARNVMTSHGIYVERHCTDPNSDGERAPAPSYLRRPATIHATHSCAIQP